MPYSSPRSLSFSFIHNIYSGKTPVIQKSYSAIYQSVQKCELSRGHLKRDIPIMRESYFILLYFTYIYTLAISNYYSQLKGNFTLMREPCNCFFVTMIFSLSMTDTSTGVADGILHLGTHNIHMYIQYLVERTMLEFNVCIFLPLLALYIQTFVQSHEIEQNNRVREV